MSKEMKNGSQTSYDNPAFEITNERNIELSNNDHNESRVSELKDLEKAEEKESQGSWNNSIEFLMSCIAMSIGFGNIWRFPFTAYKNGGGAFLIPYVILLFLVGKPFYFLEMIMGQFSGRSSIRVWNVSPAFVGVGWAQFSSTIILATYYSSLMALTLFYLISSFSAELPWSKCLEEWKDFCIDSSSKKENRMMINDTTFLKRNDTYYKLDRSMSNSVYRSSAELYFLKSVLHEKDNIDDGIGLPDWKLTLCLFGCWFFVCVILFQGVKSTGRASYFLAIFPYIVLIALLIRSVTLDGAADGILFFVEPQWEMLLKPEVWYAAVTQCFFSLSVCFGAVVTYSAQNGFKHNIYRDAMIITTLDTFTSMIAGCAIFGILGNLAYEMDIKDVGSVVKDGTGLAFISYPDAIAKFEVLPQLFSVLFFVMMFVLGIGSCVGMTSSLFVILYEQFPKLKPWQIVVPLCCLGFLIGIVYVTPGGQWVLVLADYYGTSFVVFILASFEMIGIIHVYGFENFIDDIEFMLDMKATMFWRVCWFVITPVILIVIFLYTVVNMSPLVYAGKTFPIGAHAAGVIILCMGILQIPVWMLLAILKNRHLPLKEMIRKAFQPTSQWGPKEMKYRKEWLIFKEDKMNIRNMRQRSRWSQTIRIVFGLQPK
ncbi:PREDICTED: sodium-dependent nutrient amino acid transporter 1-like [Polistes canadensis]|uniref:sodium-dependent nutrient amino acid transporter 1-like n=1 Tax=Polistes canadensis TaxID=91411 RepID=UPI000718C38C|nr:PREDICTED: sodium-dependent nutrient amino acid transporter 1-like [Polistes canadensis]